MRQSSREVGYVPLPDPAYAAVLQRDVARAQLDSARPQLSLVASGARREDLQMAWAQLDQADAKVDQKRAREDAKGHVEAGCD